MLGLTQQQMAELLGVTYQQAHKYETGINRISAGQLYQIARALGVEISHFFEDVDPHERTSHRDHDPRARTLAAPVKFAAKLMEVWALDGKELSKLIGFEGEDGLRDLMSGARKLDTRDAKDRVWHLMRIREALHSLFRDTETEREWLREPRPELQGKSPLALLSEGSMENLLVVSQFVQWMVGR